MRTPGRPGPGLACAVAAGLVLAAASLLDTCSSEMATREALRRLAVAPGDAAGRAALRLVPLAPPAGRSLATIVLGDFETPGELARWVPGSGVAVSVVPAPGRAGGRAARIAVPPGSLEGVALSGLPRDWRAFGALALDAYAAAGVVRLELGVRVDDRTTAGRPGVRYEVGVRLRPGWSAVRLPVDAIGRSIDITAVARLVIYVRRPGVGAGARIVLLDRVRLEP